MNDISKTGYKLTVSHQRDRMLNHAKPKDVFFSAGSGFWSWESGLFSKMQTIFSMGYRLHDGSYGIEYAEEMLWEAINSQAKFH